MVIIVKRRLCQQARKCRKIEKHEVANHLFASWHPSALTKVLHFALEFDGVALFGPVDPRPAPELHG